MKPHDDDRALDGALRRSLVGRGAVSGDGCPDADVLAAYYESSLDAAETQRLDVHFSDCARCREQLATLARSEPPSIDRTPARSWIWHWRWLAPVVAAAAIVLLWSGLRGREAAKVREAQIVAENRSPANAAATELAPAPPPASTPQRTTIRPPQSMQGALPPEAKELSRPAPNLTNEAQYDQKPRDEVSRQAEKMQGGASGAPAGRVVMAPASPPPQAKAQSMKVPLQSRDVAAQSAAAKASPTSNGAADASAATSAPQAAAVPQSSETVEVQSAGNAVSATAPTPPQPTSTQPANPSAATSLEIESNAPNKKAKPRNYSARSPAAGAGVSGGVVGGRIASAAKASAPGPILIVTPDRAVMWRILPAGGVELSNDGGSTWQPQPDAPAAMWTAGSAPSAKICWIVGRSGAVIRTTDGRTWETIPSPTTQDLIAIAAESAKSATIAAADGTRYKTTNGGRTWKPETAGQP